eukprot:CAMPEP_0184721092 /NCGR_PEP_ID=MMETSP0314-20130426/16830_1 /TAXON_ID=38298 /ORGANISM="Rhodella maculata, Strain CCMP 736" /LENGTH=49 /DNA_ID= /DNA_START= /DNA_END= /DNA_ORIENTATION=
MNQEQALFGIAEVPDFMDGHGGNTILKSSESLERRLQDTENQHLLRTLR